MPTAPAGPTALRAAQAAPKVPGRAYFVPIADDADKDKDVASVSERDLPDRTA